MMKIRYDRSARVAGISIVPFSRLGPERWFDRYRIASYYGWDIADLPHAPRLYSLKPAESHGKDMSEMSTASLLRQPDFVSILADELSGYDIHTYKAVSITDDLKKLPVRFNGIDPSLRNKIENKAEFRIMFANRIRMPRFDIYDYRGLNDGSVSFAEVSKGRDEFVLQDEQLSDGKGTFVIRGESDLKEALSVLGTLKAGRRAVISDLISNKHERSIQCCVTRYGVFVGPLQKQIIADPLLANLNVPGGAKFCGAEITEHDEFSAARDEISTYANIIGGVLQELGYKGIFGIDCLVDGDGNVFVIEVNPRVTGVTPLLTMLWDEGCIPFYLLHILELAGLEYTIDDQSVVRPFRDGSLLMCHSQYDTAKVLTKLPATGLYDDKASLVRRESHLDAGDEGILWQQNVPVGTLVKPGGRLLAAFMNQRVLNSDDSLSAEVSQAVKEMCDTITTKEAEEDIL